MLAFVHWLLLILFAPDLNGLGHFDWRVREHALIKCDNRLSALLLPSSHEDPEIQSRIKAIQDRQWGWIYRDNLERFALARKYEMWLDIYLTKNQSRIAKEWDTFAYIHKDRDRADALFIRMPKPLDGYCGFLVGSIVPGEYERYLKYLEYCRYRIIENHIKQEMPPPRLR